MTPQEWIQDVRESIERDDEPRPLLENLKVGADHLAAALEEITEIRKASAWIVDCEKWDSGTQLLNEKAVAQARIEHRRSSMQVSPTLPPNIEEWMMLVARKQGRDESAEEIARLRADASTASPSCDRCQSAHCCSVTGSTVPPLCVTDPDGSLPLWMPWTNADVQARVDPLHAEIGRLRAEAGRVVVPELTPDGMSTAAFVEGYRFAASRAHSVPAGRVLKDGEALVPKLTEEDRAVFEGMDAEWGYNLAASRANARVDRP